MKSAKVADLALRATAVTLAVGVSLAGCAKTAGKFGGRNVAAGMVTPFTVTGGTAVLPCSSGSHPPDPTKISTTIRIKLHENLNDLIGKTLYRRVRYSSSDSDQNEQQYEDVTPNPPDGKKHASTENTCPYNGGDLLNSCLQYSNETAPYNINLQDSGLNASGAPQWIRVKVMLPLKNSDGSDSPVSNLQFYQIIDAESNTVTLDGATVADKNATPNYVCLGQVADYDHMNDNNGSIVLILYIKTGHKTGASNILPFNIVLVPKSGAIATPILIDPKWLNNG